MAEHHEMHRIKTHSSGAEEWECSDCNRHILLQADPFKRIVLVMGNEEAQHSGQNIQTQLTSKINEQASKRSITLSSSKHKTLH